MANETEVYRRLFLDKQDELLKAMEKAIELQSELNSFEKFNPRAMKLLRERKPFIVIAHDEPYFKMAYDQIKLEELLKGTWTDEDERVYQNCVSST